MKGFNIDVAILDDYNQKEARESSIKIDDGLCRR